MADKGDVRVSISGTTPDKDTDDYEAVEYPQEGYMIDDEPRKNRPKEICVIFTLVIMCLAIIIGISLGLTRVVIEPRPYVPGVDVNCIIQGDVTEGICIQLDCVWNVTKPKHAPLCTYPHDYQRYRIEKQSETPSGLLIELTARPGVSKVNDVYGAEVENVAIQVEYQTDYRLRVKIFDKNNARYEVPQPEAVDIVTPVGRHNESTRLYDVKVIGNEYEGFGILVIRRDSGNGTVIFNTSTPGFTFADQFIQITNSLPSAHLYGLGEHNHTQFKHDMNYKNWTIFTRDAAPVDDWNLYGAQPFYMNLEKDGTANAVLLLNSNAMDIHVQPDPYPAITYRVIGGILDFYIFLGPTPEQIVQQYTEAVGRPVMPPYWALGFQLGRWNYDNLTHVREVVERNRAAGIPQDVQYGDRDYMVNKMDFTYDTNKYNKLPEFVQELHDHGQRYIIILDHCIASDMNIINDVLNGSYPAYQQGVVDDVFIKDARNPSEYLKGEVWPGEVVYPDFTKGTVVEDWWTNQCQSFWDTGVEYDALLIDMNEPSNFVQGSTTGCDNNTWNYPPYIPNELGGKDNGVLYDKTICMDAIQTWGKHYDAHSLYGHSMSAVTYNSLRKMFPSKRSLVLTRSNFVGTQKYAMHWLGDNQSQWKHIPWSIVGMLEYSLFGFSYTGADICGFWYDTTEEMCIRWMQLGAFYPFARNHNAIGWRDQDPAAFGEPMTRIARDILMTRYTLLPYLYTLMHEAHVMGNTVVRPLMHEFTSDSNTWTIDRQFLWGPALLITPVMEEGVTEIDGYFPKARWYNYYTGEELLESGTKHRLFTPLDSINLHIRGGYVIPIQEPDNTTVSSRKNKLGIIVALGDAPQYTATGSLFWDDGESHDTYTKGEYLKVSFYCSDFVLNLIVEHKGYVPPDDSLVFDTIVIWGLTRTPEWVKVNGTDALPDKWSYSEAYKVLSLTDVQMTITENHIVTWGLSV